ncbi:MAG: type II toxin-antitoxin system RelE/ParE family toxin [Treponema sp.]|nr:type II toxin-antitoxin system RelE/ParE family toxin [Treponema sp.]
MDVLIGHDAANYLKRLGKPTKSRIKASIVNLAKNPPEGDIKKLSGMDGYRARVGGLRILFKITGNIVKIHSIVPRGQAYSKKEKRK